jgi:hypothetical protein
VVSFLRFKNKYKKEEKMGLLSHEALNILYTDEGGYGDQLSKNELISCLGELPAEEFLHQTDDMLDLGSFVVRATLAA